jgi:HK97 family phage prohead protease
MTMTKTEPVSAERAVLESKRGLGASTRLYPVTGIEIRADEDAESTKLHFEGHASVTGRAYDMYGGRDKGGWSEIVDPGAFKKTLSEKPDVAFLVNHKGLTLARTKAGSLRLSEDKIGLAVDADLDKRVSIVNDISVLMEGGELDEMSFAFRIVKQKWLDVDGEEVPWWDMAGIERHLVELNLNKGDVSVVNYGANPFTDATLRSMNLGPDDIRRAIDTLEGMLPTPTVEQPNPFAERDLADRLALERKKINRPGLAA